MPTPVYSQVHNLLAAYVGDDKAEKALERQLERCDATLDTFTNSHLAGVMNYIIGAVVIYVSDKQKQEELKTKLQAIA